MAVGEIVHDQMPWSGGRGDVLSLDFGDVVVYLPSTCSSYPLHKLHSTMMTAIFPCRCHRQMREPIVFWGSR